MSSEYSFSVDWSEERENYTNHGKNVLRNKCKHKSEDGENTNLEYSGYCDKCEVSEDDAEPMMNYAYPLYSEPDEEQILKVVEQTNLTVMEHNDTGEFCLVLTGGGMDLSQDIALAYMLCDERIPDALAYSVCTQYGLSVSGKNWFKIMEEIKEELKNTMGQYKFRIKEINEAVKEAKKIKIVK